MNLFVLLLVFTLFRYNFFSLFRTSSEGGGGGGRASKSAVQELKGTVPNTRSNFKVDGSKAAARLVREGRKKMAHLTSIGTVYFVNLRYWSKTKIIVDSKILILSPY